MDKKMCFDKSNLTEQILGESRFKRIKLIATGETKCDCCMVNSLCIRTNTSVNYDPKYGFGGDEYGFFSVCIICIGDLIRGKPLDLPGSSDTIIPK